MLVHDESGLQAVAFKHSLVSTQPLGPMPEPVYPDGHAPQMNCKP